MQNKKNNFNFSSYSGKQASTYGANPCDMYNGQTLSSHINVSNTKLPEPGIRHIFSYNPRMGFLTINNCSGRYVVIFESIKSQGTLTFSKITKNNGPDVITLWDGPSLIVEDCYIVENKKSPLFYINNAGTMTVNRCYLEKNDNGINGNVNTNNIATVKFELNIEHLMTNQCIAQYTEKQKNNAVFRLFDAKIIASCHIVCLNEYGRIQSNVVTPLAVPFGE